MYFGCLKYVDLAQLKSSWGQRFHMLSSAKTLLKAGYTSALEYLPAHQGGLGRSLIANSSHYWKDTTKEGVSMVLLTLDAQKWCPGAPPTGCILFDWKSPSTKTLSLGLNIQSTCMHKALVPWPTLHKPGLVAHVYDPSTQKVETGAQKFQIILGFTGILVCYHWRPTLNTHIN